MNESEQAAHEPAASYEEIRQRLVSMGYLDKPLDRFVLSGVGRPGSFARRHAAVSFRVALAAGPPLGLLFSLAVVVVNRPRFSTVLDFLLMSFYFTMLFGVVVFLLEFVAGLVLSAIAHWRGRGVAAFHATAARAGFCVSLVLSAYLALWWRRRAGGAGGPVLDIAGLAALLVVNAALFRVSSLASLAALIRASELPPATPGKRGRAARILGLVAASLLTLGFFLAPRAAPPTAATPFDPIPVRGRLVVVAWDGIPYGALAGALSGGTAGKWQPGPDRTEGKPSQSFLAQLAPPVEGSALSRPAFWTEIATGRSAAEHGVGNVASERVAGLSSPLGLDAPLGAVLTTLLPGKKIAVNAALRRAPTVWEILGRKEGIGVVGWWATWPAAERNGKDRPFVVFTDRALFGLQDEGDVAHGIAPAAIARELAASRPADLAALRREFLAQYGSSASQPGSLLERSALIDGYAVRVAIRLLGEPGLNDFFIYLPGLDILRSAQAGAAAGSGGGIGSGGAIGPGGGIGGIDPRDATGVSSYLPFVDDRLTRLSRAMTDQDWLVVIGDPGRAGEDLQRSSTGPERLHPGFSGAWVAITGPGVAPGTASGPWAALDLAPSLLNLRGFPRSRDLKGRTQVEFLSPEWRRRLPPREVETFGDNPMPALPAEEPSDEEALERLRSLGYVR